MQTSYAPADFDDEPLLGRDGTAQRSLATLCVVYLVLGVIWTGFFLATDLPTLLDRASSAREQFASLQGEPGATPEVLEAAAGAVRQARSAAQRGWIRAGGHLAALLLLSYFLLIQRRRLSSREQVVSSATAMVVLLGAILIASRLVLQTALPDRNLAIWGIADIFVLHICACMILPWTPRESSAPFVLLLLVWAVTFLIPHSVDPQLEILDRVVAVIVSPMVLLPGLGVCAWRVRRRREDAERLLLGQQVRTMGGELSRARIVHDAMFPKPFDTGHLAFEYDYRPIAEIGGDYVHIHRCPHTGRVWLTLLDVAGHGLAAALTVNRLFGELERIRAEDPEAEPSQIMELLNRYINLTMAPHSLYATAACILLEPATGDVKWVNAGHPPALIRKAGGEIDELTGTTMLLGAQTFEEFEPNQQMMRIDAGDVIIAYTDGAFEARNAEGRQFGIKGLRSIAEFNPPPRNWARFIANAVSKHHGGHAEDDVLVASLQLRSLFIGALRHEAGRTDVPSKAEMARIMEAGGS
ncbi:MAG: PP2C family protein-serine/threonine phosphatase [Planctomycetota bacterium]|jgi:serine phosphatase RsbU (regulator of sigma subunit)